MVGKTATVRKPDKVRMQTIHEYCGCLPCLLMGYLDVQTSIEHVTNRGRRVGEEAQHQWTIGLCIWHHFGWTRTRVKAHVITAERGPSLALGRVPFEEHFGDEVRVLVPLQDFVLEQFAEKPWPEYNLPRNVARLTRNEWISLNHADAQSTSRSHR